MSKYFDETLKKYMKCNDKCSVCENNLLCINCNTEKDYFIQVRFFGEENKELKNNFKKRKYCKLTKINMLNIMENLGLY